jgi:hypothetical protein
LTWGVEMPILSPVDVVLLNKESVMGKKTKEDILAAKEAESLRAEARGQLLAIAQADGATSSNANGSRAKAGELLRQLNFVPADEKVEGSDSAKLKEDLRKSYFLGYATDCTPLEQTWLASNSVKGIPDAGKAGANILLEQARAAWGMFWRGAKKSAGLVSAEPARPVGGEVAAGEPGESEGEATVDSKEAAAKLLADGDLALAEWLLWAASKDGRGHLKAAYAAYVPA